MKFVVNSDNPLTQKTDLLVVCYLPKDKSSLFTKLDTKLKKEASQLLKKQDFKGKAGEAKLIYTKGKLGAENVLILGVEDKKFNLESIRKIGVTVLSVAKKINAKSCVAELAGSSYKDISSPNAAQSVVEGILLSHYKFDHYLKSPNKTSINFSLYAAKASDVTSVRKAVRVAEHLSEGVCLARDLINLPASDLTPLEMAKTARKIKGVRTRVHNLAGIKKLKMGAFLSVAQGSKANPPCFIEMHYKPKTKPKKKVAIVGKGVTFDSGGYSLKPPKAMETMKDDMSGAAAVIGLMSIISKLQPKVEVSAYIAATENMVDSYAQRPGDVCKAMNGKTIEVLNTDAEGRLTLADALHYANKKKPDYMIDMATLTGACLVALGLRYTGIMGNDQGLIDKLIKCGLKCEEKMWQLPLADEYRDGLKSTVADLKNIGASYGGSITAGIFLEHFVGKTKWAHLDIAGPAWTDGPLAYTPRGGCGVMVRTLAEFLDGF
jgi:leucyl aminopeptidase